MSSQYHQRHHLQIRGNFVKKKEKACTMVAVKLQRSEGHCKVLFIGVAWIGSLTSVILHWNLGMYSNHECTYIHAYPPHPISYRSAWTGASLRLTLLTSPHLLPPAGPRGRRLGFGPLDLFLWSAGRFACLLLVLAGTVENMALVIANQWGFGRCCFVFFRRSVHFVPVFLQCHHIVVSYNLSSSWEVSVQLWAMHGELKEMLSDSY